MNDKEYLEWINGVISDRRKFVKMAKHDILFAKNQIKFWNEYLAQAEQTLKNDMMSVEEALRWKAERK